MVFRMEMGATKQVCIFEKFDVNLNLTFGDSYKLFWFWKVGLNKAFFQFGVKFIFWFKIYENQGSSEMKPWHECGFAHKNIQKIVGAAVC